MLICPFRHTQFGPKFPPLPFDSFPMYVSVFDAFLLPFDVFSMIRSIVVSNLARPIFLLSSKEGSVLEHASIPPDRDNAHPL